MSTFEPVEITINSRHIDFLREHRIFVCRSGAYRNGWLKVGARFSLSAPVFIEPYAEQSAGPNFFSQGSFSFSRSALPPAAKVGRYCVMANKIDVMREAHPTQRLSVANIDYKNAHACFLKAIEDSGKRPLDAPPFQNLSPINIEIENDVWIGAGVLLKRNVRVGTGSIIAARTVVTKDVPPYSIFAGNPGRERKSRFAPDLVDGLLASRWWEYRFTDFHGLDTANPEVFLRRFERAKIAGDIFPWRPAKVALHTAFAELA